MAKELSLNSLLTHRFSIDDTQKAFENAKNRVGIKTAVSNPK
jgi:threonine dehydrogenase-like Zn-dependent dehydrogenase